MTTTPKKKALLAKIHIAKKDLCLDDGMYRDILKRVTGKDSSSKMLISELEKVIAEFGNLGWKPSVSKAYKTSQNYKDRYGRKPNIGEAHQSRKTKVDKIEALLADMGKHWNYAHSIAKRVTKGEKLNVDFCSDEELTKIISALTRTQKNEAKKQEATKTT